MGKCIGAARQVLADANRFYNLPTCSHNRISKEKRIRIAADAGRGPMQATWSTDQVRMKAKLSWHLQWYQHQLRQTDCFGECR